MTEGSAIFDELMGQVWKDREQPQLTDWNVEWRQVADLCSAISVHDPRHEPMMDCLHDADQAYKHRDAIVFRNIIMQLCTVKRAGRSEA